MKFSNSIKLLLGGLLLSSALTMPSCKDEEVFPAPTVLLSASEFTGKTGETATVTATVTLPAA